MKSILDTKDSVFLLFQTFLLVIGVVGVMVAAIPWTAIPVIPLGIIFFFLRRYFLETSRDVKRLECSSEYWDSQVWMAMQVGCIYTIINHTPEVLQNISFRIAP